MKILHRGLAFGGFLLLVAAFVTNANAEVSVRTDADGKYAGIQILTTGGRGEPVVWGPNGRTFRRQNILNPRGDRNGDLWPELAESTLAPHYPWAVWSRFNGDNYDLAWSRWTGNGWSPVLWVEWQAQPGHDFDPDLGFDDEGRAYLVWSREVQGMSRIYFSVFLDHRWMTGVAVTEPGIDSRRPHIVNTETGCVEVEYETPEGTALRRVVFSNPVTITDDINPMTVVSVKGTPRYQ